MVKRSGRNHPWIVFSHKQLIKAYYEYWSRRALAVTIASLFGTSVVKKGILVRVPLILLLKKD